MLDLTSLWVLTQKHKNGLAILTALIVVFGAGLQLGRATSPLYNSSPIIFSESSTACSEEGSPEALNLVRQAGLEAKQATKSSPMPTVAGVTTEEASTEAQSGMYVASINSTLYHHKDCSTAARIKPENQVWFISKEEAEAAGYSPSACTQGK